jgi:hypothetical protein
MAPNASTRIRSVTGSEMISARWRSSATVSSKALSIVPVPASCVVTAGCARSTAATAATTGPILSLRVLGIAAQRDLDEHGAAPGGREGGRVARAGHAARDRQALEAPLQVGGRGGGRRPVAGADEDLLDPGLLEAARVDALVGARGIAGAGVGRRDVARAGHPAADGEADDEQQPEGDHGLGTARGAAGDPAHGAREQAARSGGARRAGAGGRAGGGHGCTIVRRSRGVAGAQWRLAAGRPRNGGGAFPTVRVSELGRRRAARRITRAAHDVGGLTVGPVARRRGGRPALLPSTPRRSRCARPCPVLARSRPFAARRRPGSAFG